jgi:type II secretory pathway component PulF
MCDEPVPMLLNETNQTSPNVTTINLPQFNIKAILSDPTTLLALGIIVAVVIVFIVMRKKKMRENAANFHFP